MAPILSISNSFSKSCIFNRRLYFCQNIKINTFDAKPSHRYKLCLEGSEIFNNLENLEPSLSDEIKISIGYLAKYITRNDNQPREYETRFYYEKYGK